jgi:hypothetical protein
MTDNRHYKERHRNFAISREVCLQINIEKTKYMLLSCHYNAGGTDCLNAAEFSGNESRKSKFHSGGN